jgi:hypothetical protein
MTFKQKLKIRIEIGPGMPIELAKFNTPDARAAMLMALFRALTAGEVYPGPDAAFEGVKGGCAVSVEPTATNSGADDFLPSTQYTEWKAIITLESTEDGGEEASREGC